MTIKKTIWLLGLCLASCSMQDRYGRDMGDAAGTGDAYEARRVSGARMLSTDYHYQDRCNYLPEEFVRNLFKLGEAVELEKYSHLDSCEFRWGRNRIGFYLESAKPFESTFQSEYFFDKLFQPGVTEAMDKNASAKPTIHGPAPQGTNSELPASTTTTSSQQDSARGGDPSAPLEGITDAVPPIASPAQNTATGEAVSEVGDKAIWEPGKKSLHVLHNNHVFSVEAQMPGNPAQLKQGVISLAKIIVYHLNEDAHQH